MKTLKAFAANNAGRDWVQTRGCNIDPAAASDMAAPSSSPSRPHATPTLRSIRSYLTYNKTRHTGSGSGWVLRHPCRTTSLTLIWRLSSIFFFFSVSEGQAWHLGDKWPVHDQDRKDKLGQFQFHQSRLNAVEDLWWHLGRLRSSFGSSEVRNQVGRDSYCLLSPSLEST